MMLKGACFGKCSCGLERWPSCDRLSSQSKGREDSVMYQTVSLKVPKPRPRGVVETRDRSVQWGHRD